MTPVGRKSKRIAVNQDQLGQLTGRPGIQLTGVTLRQAFAEYEREIKDKKKYKTPDGKRKPWGQTQLNNLTSITEFYLQGNREISPSSITGMPVVVDGGVYVTFGGDIRHGRRQSWLSSLLKKWDGPFGSVRFRRGIRVA